MKTRSNGPSSVAIVSSGSRRGIRTPSENLTHRDSCTGSEADVAHQIVGALRSGSYRIGGRAGVPFSRVALAGHSTGSIIAQVEAYSFRDIDALVITAYADQGQTPLLLSESSFTVACLWRGADRAAAPSQQVAQHRRPGVRVRGP